MTSPSLLNVNATTVANADRVVTITVLPGRPVIEKKKKATTEKKATPEKKVTTEKKATTEKEESVAVAAIAAKKKRAGKILLAHLDTLANIANLKNLELRQPEVVHEPETTAVATVEEYHPVAAAVAAATDADAKKKRVVKPRAPSTKKLAAITAAASAVCEVVTMVHEMKQAFTSDSEKSAATTENPMIAVIVATSDGILEEEDYVAAVADVAIDTDFTDEMIQDLALDLPETPMAHRVLETTDAAETNTETNTDTNADTNRWIEDDELFEIASIPDEDHEYTATTATTAGATTTTYDFDFKYTENATEKPKKAPKEPKQPKERKERVTKAPKELEDRDRQQLRQLKPKTVFRHEFSELLFQALTAFTTATAVIDATHFKLSNAKAFKTAWIEWVSTHQVEIAEEVARLASIGYTGDAVDKMFKTCRYYITNRIASCAKTAASGSAAAPAAPTTSDLEIEAETDAEIEPENENDSKSQSSDADATESESIASSGSSGKKKRAYIPIAKSLLHSMDEHIIMTVLNADDSETSPKPSECYAEFCSRFQELIATETARLLSSSPSESAISEKLKKTYKNRMFMVHRAHA